MSHVAFNVFDPLFNLHAAQRRERRHEAKRYEAVLDLGRPDAATVFLLFAQRLRTGRTRPNRNAPILR